MSSVIQFNQLDSNTYLCCEEILLPLRNQRVVYELLLHVYSYPTYQQSSNRHIQADSIPFCPLPTQSIPNLELPSVTCRLLTSARVSIGGRPLFSESARGTASSAEAKARIAYCSIDGICMVQLLSSLSKESKSKHIYLICGLPYGN
jgi:hypothetical protein